MLRHITEGQEMIAFFKWFYQNLGNSKSQKFRRFFLILLLMAGVTVYGFYKDSINVSIGKMIGGDGIVSEGDK